MISTTVEHLGKFAQQALTLGLHAYRVRARSACNQGFTRCDANSGSCFNLQADTNNSGSCGHVCPRPSGPSIVSCEAGTSVLLTAAQTRICAENPTYPKTTLITVEGAATLARQDPTEAPRANSAQGWTVVLVMEPYAGYLQPGIQTCSGSCVNLTSDAHNCGACGNACGNFQICASGQCTTLIGH